VSKGSAEGLSNSVLTVTGDLVNGSEATERPTTWLVIDQGEVEGGPEFTNITLMINKSDIIW